MFFLALRFLSIRDIGTEIRATDCKGDSLPVPRLERKISGPVEAGRTEPTNLPMKRLATSLGRFALAIGRNNSFRVLAAVAAVATPQASVTCQRQLVPDTTIEVQTPHGIGVRSGGGKTVISGQLPFGVSVRPD